ncbi:MAG: CoA transferase [Dehalococcoidia bacterium]|nr:MAG: CoA transferase [Dehalococcoidia bacterium]
MNDTALAHVKVLELCSMVAGPYCTKLMADLGAEVIKIEEPGTGDEARGRGPFLNDTPHHERSGLFFYLNTNKLGITLNVDSAQGRDLFRRLVGETDILVEDRPPKALDSAGLGYEILAEINPRLVMTSITPFGQNGPYKDYKAYPLNSFHSCGEGYVTPGHNPFPDRAPLKQGRFVGEYEVGIQSALATLGALYYQRATGKGQHIDISKQEALIGISTAELSFYPNLGFIPTRGTRGYTVGGIMPCKDGFVEICLYSEQDWEGLVKLMGDPEWAHDEKYKDIPSRAGNSSEVQQLLTDWLMQHTMEEIYQGGQKLRVPIGAYYSPRDLLGSRHLKSRGFFADVDHPQMGTVTCPTAPYRFSRTPWHAERAAPLIGEHNEAIYHERLGYSKQDLVTMTGQGII